MFYRVKQFFWDIGSNFKNIDNNYVDKYLNNEEKEVFYELLKAEQFHSIRVSKDLVSTYFNLNNHNNKVEDKMKLDSSELARLGLLHDLGKRGLSYGPLSKSLFVILKKISKGNLNKYSKFKKTILYYNHAMTGVNILNKMNSRIYSKEFIEAVRMHHSKGDIICKSNNEYLIALNRCDDRN